ncbi:hypothetical protein BACPU_06260 [Bacillus pumilus]|nr:hypothetical protein BACPU_06260 [Bacillus pumilus]
MIKEFHEWRRDQGLSVEDYDLISEITVCLSTLKYGVILPMDKQNAILDRYLNTFPNAGLPETLQDVKKITFQDFADIVKNGTGKKVDVAELIYSIYKQGLCKELCVHLLESSESKKAKDLLFLIKT